MPLITTKNKVYMGNGRRSDNGPWTISGTILDGLDAPIVDVNVVFGTVGDADTGADGTYSINLIPDETAGTLTPTLSGYTFEPETIAIAAMTASLTGQDFVGTVVP